MNTAFALHLSVGALSCNLAQTIVSAGFLLLGEGDLGMGWVSGVQFNMARKLRQRVLEAAGPVESAVRKKRATSECLLIVPTNSLGPHHKSYRLQWLSLPTSLRTIRTAPTVAAKSPS